MKKLLLLSLLFVVCIFANAQSGSDTLTSKPAILGGDGTGKFESIQWSATGPAGGTFSSPTGLSTIFTVSVPGVYTVTATVKDNLGNTNNNSIVITAYKAQGIKVDVSASSSVIIIK